MTELERKLLAHCVALVSINSVHGQEIVSERIDFTLSDLKTHNPSSESIRYVHDAAVAVCMARKVGQLGGFQAALSGLRSKVASHFLAISDANDPFAKKAQSHE